MDHRVVPINQAGQVHLEQLAGTDSPDEAIALEDLVIPTDDQAVAELVRIYLAQGALGNDLLGTYGRRCGVTYRTMRNRVNAVLSQMRAPESTLDRSWQLTSEVLEVIAAHRGRLEPAHTDLEDNNIAVPSLSTLRRRWRDLPVAYRNFIESGRAAMLKAWAYIPYTAPYRNAVWQGDFFELAIDTIPDGFETTTVKPWLLVFVDDFSGAPTCWDLICVPDRRGGGEMTVATLASGYEGREIEGVLVGGVPEIVRVDNDAAFENELVDTLAAVAGNEIHAVPPHTPFFKGKAERLGQILEEDLLGLLHGYTHGPLTYSGRNPFRDSGPMTEAMLRAFVNDWFDARLTTHVQARLEHGTPLRQWASCDSPVRQIDTEALRPFLLELGRSYKVQTEGVWWDGGYWTGPGITQVIGRQVTVRRPVGTNPGRIEIFLDGQWKLTAYRAETLSRERREAIWRERGRIYDDALADVEAAAVRRAEATTEAHRSGVLPSPAGASAGDTYSANVDDMWDILDEDPDEDWIAANDANVTPKRRTKMRKPRARQRHEIPDPGPATDLWALFDDEPDSNGAGGGHDSTVHDEDGNGAPKDET